MHHFCGKDGYDNHFIVDKNGLLEGDHVQIMVSPGIGLRATFWAYFLPFLLMLLTIIFALKLGASESLSGFLSIGILPLYYLLIHLFKHRLKRQFQLKVIKQ
jgi:positive regulator of sigma E activity